jgi:hypothetical protein
MKATIDGIQVSGTPEELKRFKELCEGEKTFSQNNILIADGRLLLNARLIPDNDGQIHFESTNNRRDQYFFKGIEKRQLLSLLVPFKDGWHKGKGLIESVESHSDCLFDIDIVVNRKLEKIEHS